MPAPPRLSGMPFVRLLLPLLLGIALQLSQPQAILFWASTGIAGVICLIVFLIAGRRKKYYHNNWLYGLLFYLLLFASGGLLTKFHTDSPQTLSSKQPYTLIFTINDPPVEKNNSYRLTGEVSAIGDSNHWEDHNFKLLLYIEKDTGSQKLKYGDRLLLQSYLNPIKNAGNPHEFDYKAFMAKRGYYHQGYVQSKHWQLLAQQQGSMLKQKAHELRNHLLKNYQQHKIGGREFSVLSALTLGYKAKLNQNIREIYANTGAMHILAVSGLHVGIIYLLLSQILQLMLGHWRHANILIAILTIITIWIFALVSGLSPSVQRAALMFSFLRIGQSMNRLSSVYNSLAASAFILLLVNPYMLSEVGFQLSYLAVLSILIIQPWLRNRFESRFAFLNKIWELLSVSFAAQIGLLPLLLYYFHQFPIYFWLSGLIVIPLAFIILAGSILLWLFHWWLPVANILASGLKWLVWLMNTSLEWIAGLPGAVIRQVSFHLPELLLTYTGLLSLIIFISSKRQAFFLLSLGTLIGTIAINTYYIVVNRQQDIVICYALSDGWACDFVQGRQHLLLSDKNTKSESLLNYATSAFYTRHHLKSSNALQLNDSLEIENYPFVKVCQSAIENQYYLAFKRKIFLFVGSDALMDYHSQNKQTVDYIILTGKHCPTIAHLKTLYKFECLILTSNINWYQQKILKADCNKYSIDCHILGEDGAFMSVLSD